MKCKDARRAIVLDHYGESTDEERARLDAHCRSCAACAADRDETRRILALVSEGRTVSLPDFDRERAWQAVRRGMNGSGRPRRSSPAVVRPRRALAGAGLVAVLIVGVVIGRFAWKSAPSPAATRAATQAPFSNPAAPTIRPVLDSHFEDLRPLILDFANSVNGGAPASSISIDERLLRGLLLQNALLRSAVNGNDPRAAELLDDLDLVLKEIVNAKSPGGASTAQVRDLIRDRGILFRMQILKTI